ncbi:MAG: His/Gly/Thr/Pro-type tRNA ligase C-terminal domain-containing protein [Pyrinomonadaceae bacterium]
MCILGESEIADNTVTLQNMQSGEKWENIQVTEAAERIAAQK